MRHFVSWTLGLGAISSLCWCGPGGVSETEESTCTLAGHWKAHEEWIGGECLPDRAPATAVVFDISELDMTDEGTLWRFDLSRGGVRLESCSGVPGDDRCSLEMTCRGIAEEGRIGYAFTLELSASGALSGSNVLTITPDEGGDACEAHFRLEGERVSPEELESNGKESVP